MEGRERRNPSAIEGTKGPEPPAGDGHRDVLVMIQVEHAVRTDLRVHGVITNHISAGRVRNERAVETSTVPATSAGWLSWSWA